MHLLLHLCVFLDVSARVYRFVSIFLHLLLFFRLLCFHSVPIFLSVFLFLHLWVCLYIWVCVHRSVCVYVCVPLCLSLWPAILCQALVNSSLPMAVSPRMVSLGQGGSAPKA